MTAVPLCVQPFPQRALVPTVHWMLKISASPPATDTTSPTPFPNSARAKGEACEIVPARWIGFVLSNDSEGLLAAVIADDRYGMTKSNDGIVLRFRRHDGG